MLTLMKVKLQEMESFAEDFLSEITKRDPRQSGDDEGGRGASVVVGLSGNLGAGKTTFTQQAAKKLGVTDAITSPTFVIMKNYPLENQKFENLIHIDAYRLESEKELEVLDFKEMISDPKNLIFIEWPEKVSGILPENMKTVSFEVVDEETREIKI